MLHDLMVTWFGWVEQWGYWGVFFLMALESSVVPVPSEVVMPPAAFWAAQGKLNLWGVIAAGSLGSYFGSAIGYWIAQWVGYPLMKRYGKYFLLPPKKLELAERWVTQFGVPGIFIARLLPVVRHLISYPAGIFKMPFGKFSLATLTGATLWCAVLSAFGARVLGSHPELLNSPADMVAAIRAQLVWFVGAVVCFGILYLLVVAFRSRRWKPARPK